MLKNRSDFEDERSERLWKITVIALMIPVIIWVAIVIAKIIEKS